MVSIDRLVKIVQKRLGDIQDKYNFDPNIGADQVDTNDHPELKWVHGRFSELCFLAKKLDIQIPHKPLGLSVESQNESIVRKQKIYFITDDVGDNYLFVKFGRSIHSHTRKKQHQTGNPKELFISAIVDVPDGMTPSGLEAKLKRYLKKRKEERGGTEWARLDRQEIKNIAKNIVDDPDFLNGPALFRIE